MRRSSHSGETRSSSADVVTRSSGPSSASSRSRTRSTGLAATFTCGGCPQRRGLREQTEIVVDQPPALPRRQVRPDGAQRRAGAAGEIDDRDRGLIDERVGDRVEHGARCARRDRRARATPATRRKSRSCETFQHAREARGLLAPGRKPGGARAGGEPRALLGLSIRRRNAAASAATSSGGTSTPASAGTVSGIAPAVVPTTGTPWAIASA